MERYKNERIDESQTCTYNEYGDLETVTIFLDGAGDYTTTYTYKYENSRKIKKYSANNKLTESYEYNNDGLLVKSQSYNFDGEPSGWTDYVYAIKKTITPSSSDNTTSQNTTPSIKINYNRNLKAEDYMNMPLSQLTNMYGNNYSTYQKNSTYVCYDDAIHFHLDENNVIKCVSVDENVCGITEYNIEIGKTTIYDIETLTNGDYTYNDVEINDMYEDQYLLVINDGEFMWYIDFNMNGVCISAFVKVSDIPVEKTAQTYQEKIEEYRTAITMSEESFENEYDYGSDCRSINSLMVNYARYYDGEIYYTEYDIDNNGVSELIFSYQRKGEYSNTNEIIDIYTINNNGVVTKLFKNCYFGERDRIHILPSGRLLNEGSSSEYSGSCSLYDIDTATGKVINSSNYYYDGNGSSSYYADYTYLSKEEYLDLLDSLGEYVFETLAWTKL